MTASRHEMTHVHIGTTPHRQGAAQVQITCTYWTGGVTRSALMHEATLELQAGASWGARVAALLRELADQVESHQGALRVY